MSSAQVQLEKLERLQKLDRLLNGYEDTDFYFYLRLKQQLEQYIVFNFYSFETDLKLTENSQETLNHIIENVFHHVSDLNSKILLCDPIVTLCFEGDEYKISFTDKVIQHVYTKSKNLKPRAFGSYKTEYDFQNKKELRPQGYTARIQLVKCGPLRQDFELRFEQNRMQRLNLYQQELKDHVTSALFQYTKNQTITLDKLPIISQIGSYYGVTIKDYDDISKIRKASLLWDGGLKDIAYIRMLAKSLLDNPGLLTKDISLLERRMDNLLYHERQIELDNPTKE